MQKNAIVESLEKSIIKKNKKQIVKNGISAKILFVLVFLDVKIFRP